MDPRPSDGMHRASRLVGQLVNAFPHVNGRHCRTLGLLRPAVVIGASGHGVGNESMPEPSRAAGGSLAEPSPFPRGSVAGEWTYLIGVRDGWVMYGRDHERSEGCARRLAASSRSRRPEVLTSASPKKLIPCQIRL
jgi:hypothetical protein